MYDGGGGRLRLIAASKEVSGPTGCNPESMLPDAANNDRLSWHRSFRSGWFTLIGAKRSRLRAAAKIRNHQAHRPKIGK